MPLYIGQPNTCCWLCGGAGWITTGADERHLDCGMCAGSGVAHEVPSTVAEMVNAIAAMEEDVEHVTLTAAEIDAAVAEFGPVIEAALNQIGMEEAQAGQPSPSAE